MPDVYIPTNDGRWVSEKFSRLAEIIQDYDPQFELRWIPPEHRRDHKDRKEAFCIFDTVGNYVVLYASEDETPERILGRLFDSDNKHGDVLARLDAHNNAIEAFELKKRMEEAEEKQEFVSWLIGNPKNYLQIRDPKTNEKVRLDHELRRIK